MKHTGNSTARPDGFRRSALPVMLAVLLAGCWPFGAEAPLSDGLYLEYDFAGSSLRITFSTIDADTFSAALTSGASDDDLSGQDSPANRTLVDRQLKKKETGAPYDGGMLGPLWIPPSSVKKGGSAHGDTVDEVIEWRGWTVGVVRASFGRGALSGEWYYEKESGFLVGGRQATVINPEGSPFILTGSNLPGLAE